MIGKRQETAGRIFLGFTGVLIIFLGIASLLLSGGFYNNYWGGLVFGPFAIAGGMLALYLCLFKFDAMNEKARRRRKKKKRHA